MDSTVVDDRLKQNKSEDVNDIMSINTFTLIKPN